MEFSGGPLVRSLCFHCRGPGFSRGGELRSCDGGGGVWSSAGPSSISLYGLQQNFKGHKGPSQDNTQGPFPASRKVTASPGASRLLSQCVGGSQILSAAQEGTSLASGERFSCEDLLESSFPGFRT